MSVRSEVTKLSTGDDTNSIVIEVRIELTEELVSQYIELDELLRVHDDKTEVLDAMLDFGWSFSNNVLYSQHWENLPEMLEQVKYGIWTHEVSEHMK
jgi:hypothetical protein